MSHEPHADVGVPQPELAYPGESSIEALQRFEAECGWSDAPRLLAESFRTTAEPTSGGNGKD
jgi:hypothetical protein